MSKSCWTPEELKEAEATRRAILDLCPECGHGREHHGPFTGTCYALDPDPKDLVDGHTVCQCKYLQKKS